MVSALLGDGSTAALEPVAGCGSSPSREFPARLTGRAKHESGAGRGPAAVMVAGGRTAGSLRVVQPTEIGRVVRVVLESPGATRPAGTHVHDPRAVAAAHPRAVRRQGRPPRGRGDVHVVHGGGRRAVRRPPRRHPRRAGAGIRRRPRLAGHPGEQRRASISTRRSSRKYGAGCPGCGQTPCACAAADKP